MSAEPLLLDSNIVVHILQGNAELARELEGRKLHISVVTRIELYSWPGRDAGRTAWLDAFLAECEVIEMDRPIQDLTITLKRKHKLPLADSVIAATAQYRDLALITADKDFKRFGDPLRLVLYTP